MLARFSAELFRILLPFTSQDTTRVYLNGVLIQPHPAGGVFMMATDGHRMLVVHDRDGKAQTNLILPWSGSQKPLKAERKHERRVIEVYDLQRSKLDNANASIEGKLRIFAGQPRLRDDRYPDPKSQVIVHNAEGVGIDGCVLDWRRTIPSGPFGNTGVPAVNGFYLGEFGEAGVALGAYAQMGRGAAQQAYWRLPEDPIVIRWPAVDFAVGILMPLRGSLIHELPDFLDATDPQQLAA
jgi:hypothetical protein